LLGKARTHSLGFTAGLHVDLVVPQKTTRRKSP
jgi:hypothetical protein